MKISGDFSTGSSPESVYGFAMNLHRISSIIPDLVDYQIEDDTRMKVRSKAGVSFVRGTFVVILEILDHVENREVKIHGKGSGAGASIDFTATYRLEPEGKGTRVSWELDLIVAGVAATLGSRMINDAVNKYVKQLVDAFRNELQ